MFRKCSRTFFEILRSEVRRRTRNCRSRQAVFDEYLMARSGVATAENGPLKVRDRKRGVNVTTSVRQARPGKISVSRYVEPTGSFRVPIFQTLSEARSQLYQRRFLRPRPHFSAFFKLYIFSFAPFQISLIFQDLCTIFGKIRCNSC